MRRSGCARLSNFCRLAAHMKIHLVCSECLFEQGQPGRLQLIQAPYYEDRVAHIECELGHKTIAVLQDSKFEVLMESGAAALANDFTLEAAASFSTALERFYEFGLKVLFKQKGLDTAAYENMFSEMARQSE